MTWAYLSMPDTAGTPPEWWGTDYVVGGIYELKQPVLLVREPQPVVGIRYAIMVGAGVPSLQEYYSEGPEAFPMVVAVLEPGTRLRFEEIRIYDGGPVYGFCGIPVGTLLAGKFRDVGPIDMFSISYGQYRAENVDPDYLRLVESPYGK